MAGRREMQVQALVVAQKKIAKPSAAILRAVMVVACAATGHQGNVAAAQQIKQPEQARPVRHCLHALPVIRPARTGARQWQRLDIAGGQFQVQGYLPVPVGHQSGWQHRHMNCGGQYDAADASAAKGGAAPVIRNVPVLYRVRFRRVAHPDQCSHGDTPGERAWSGKVKTWAKKASLDFQPPCTRTALARRPATARATAASSEFSKISWK